MKICALSMVKNEQDIIEPFVRHHLGLMDVLYIQDNGSVDKTREILFALVDEYKGRLIVTTDTEFAYRQSERMSKLFATVQPLMRADFMLFLDADEFVGCASRAELESQLLVIPPGHQGYAEWWPGVLRGDEYHRPDPLTSFRWMRRERNRGLVFRKAILRLGGSSPRVTVAQGNHFVLVGAGLGMADAMAPECQTDIRLYHFPVRSLAQVTAKAVVGWMAITARDPNARAKGDGLQWAVAYDAAIMGTLDVAVESFWYTQPNRGGAIDWDTAVVPLDFRFEYERKYSDGQPMDALRVIAKSWERMLATR